MQQRNEDLDFLKGIGICFVVFGHCITSALEVSSYPLHILKEVIYTFHMPIFFIVSGYIQGMRSQQETSLKRYGISQVRKYFMPYMTWSVLLYVFYFMLNRLNQEAISERISLNPVSMIRDILVYNVRTGNVLWFVYILFIISVISRPIHNRLHNKYLNAFFLVLVLLAGFAANNLLGDELFVLKRFLVMWIYYELGVFTGRYKTGTVRRANIPVTVLLVLLYGLLFRLYMFTGGMAGNALKVLCAMLAVWFFYSLSRYKNNKLYGIFNFLGKRTSIIYYLHNPYIVLTAMTALTSYAGLNFAVAMVAAFSLGILIPLVVGKLAIKRVNLLKYVFLGEKVWIKQ